MEKEKPIRLGGENYVLRLYRRESENGEQALIGLLEDPLSGQEWSFRSMEELKALLQAQSKTEPLETE
jgi:hypothetical protein